MDPCPILVSSPCSNEETTCQEEKEIIPTSSHSEINEETYLVYEEFEIILKGPQREEAIELFRKYLSTEEDQLTLLLGEAYAQDHGFSLI